MAIALTQFAGRAGDHNDRAMRASRLLADVLAQRLSTSAVAIGRPLPALSTEWEEELAVARPDLDAISARFEEVLVGGDVPVTALGRCAVALATLPVVARHRPDAVVVWFDAHADLNTPATTTTGFLGGLALAGPVGLWESGLGAGLDLRNVILVGARDLDRPEQRLVDGGTIASVPIGPHMEEELRAAIDGRPVYVHLDCDALEPGLVPTDYAVPDGMSLEQLRRCAGVVAEHEVVGIQVAELETADGPDAESDQPARRIVDAVEPIHASLVGTG